MPELPEVDRVVTILRENCLGKVIQDVLTTEDAIVYDQITHEQFAQELKGRRVSQVARYGKVFYLILDGNGRHPVMHLGMTGNVYVRGTNPFLYKSSSKKEDAQWPPRFMKFVLRVAGSGEDNPTSASASTSVDNREKEIIFVDARRLGRIRLVANPLTEPPISNLGFDPLLSMPSLAEFTPLIKKRAVPIKSLLLDQHHFSAGVGNWVADEVLFHSRIHPEQKSNTLTDEQITVLHDKIVYVCRTAVDVKADSSLFPKTWLFNHRWGKGKNKTGDLLLESGEKATIKWITIGSRTSAFVPRVQVLSSALASTTATAARKGSSAGRKKGKANQEENSSDNNDDAPPEIMPTSSVAVAEDSDSSLTDLTEDEVVPAKVVEIASTTTTTTTTISRKRISVSKKKRRDRDRDPSTSPEAVDDGTGTGASRRKRLKGDKPVEAADTPAPKPKPTNLRRSERRT